MNAFAVIIAFSSWDACWSYVYDNGLQDQQAVFCERVTVAPDTPLVDVPAQLQPPASAAPASSLRPKARVDG